MLCVRIGAGCSILLLLATLTDKIGMCLTIPKKVIEIKENFVVVETHTGDRQELKNLVESLQVGDFVLSQQNVAIEKMDRKNAEEIFDIIKGETSHDNNKRSN